MICAIMQPTYIPWIGYFDMIDKVDVFVFLDDVQMERRSWQVRNRLKGANGEVWITLPVKKSKHRDLLTISEAVLNNEEQWIKKHIKTIELNYRNSTFFSEVFPCIKEMYNNPVSLRDFNVGIVKNIAEKINIDTRFIYSSSLKEICGIKDDKLAAICKEIGADNYLSPQGSMGYINRNKEGGAFAENKIDLFYHNYSHPIYRQQFGDFIPFMGIFDLLFNEGFGYALDIIRKGRKDNIHYQSVK